MPLPFWSFLAPGSNSSQGWRCEQLQNFQSFVWEFDSAARPRSAAARGIDLTRWHPARMLPYVAMHCHVMLLCVLHLLQLDWVLNDSQSVLPIVYRSFGCWVLLLIVPWGNAEKTEIQDVLLVGGSAHVPKLREMLRELFGKESFFWAFVLVGDASR